MTRAKLPLTVERLGGAVASWLVPSGKEVREGQPILRYKAGSTEKEYLAPISGTLSWSTLLDGALDFCTHEELLSGKLCLRCGFDVSTLSRKAQELVEAHRSSTMQGYRMRGGTGHSITMSDARAREADVRKLVSSTTLSVGLLDSNFLVWSSSRHASIRYTTRCRRDFGQHESSPSSWISTTRSSTPRKTAGRQCS